MLFERLFVSIEMNVAGLAGYCKHCQSNVVAGACAYLAVDRPIVAELAAVAQASHTCTVLLYSTMSYDHNNRRSYPYPSKYYFGYTVAPAA